MAESRIFTPITGDTRTAREVPDELSAVVHESAVAVLQIVRSVEKYRRKLAAHLGVSVTELRAVGLIAESDTVTPRQLADRLDLTTGSVTALLDRLEEGDLVRRTRHPSDRRSVQLELTEDGSRIMMASYRIFQQRLLYAVESLPPGSVANVTAFMRLASEGYDAAIDETFD
ncbi:MAG TPA: MarR family transcriptional regulator [Naasia sp.]|jgi:DNA-binding MarR family transcriptional regulator